MSLELFFLNFDELIKTPDDVQRLDEVILELAIRGKLTPFERLNVADMQLQRSSHLRPDRKQQHIEQKEEFPFLLPVEWHWSYLDEITDLITDGEHATPPRSSNGAIPLATAKNIRDGYIDLSNTDFVELDIAEKSWKRCKPEDNDILMVCVGATTGRLCLSKTTPRMVLVRSVALLRPAVSSVLPEYLELALRSISLQQQIWSSVKQTAQPCLYINRMKRLVIPLPPINEQQDIVEKVDQLMNETRAFSQRLAISSDSVMTINSTSLNRIQIATDDHALDSAWRTVADNFDLLYSDPRNIPQLRQTILDLAIRGKLVPQDPSDEPISKLLIRLESEKSKLEAHGELKKNELPSVEVDELAHVPVGLICDVKGGIQKSRNRQPNANPRRYLTVAHVQRGSIDSGDPRYFEVSDEELARWRLEPGDLLVVEGNGSAEHIGRSAIFMGEIEDCVHQNHVIRVRPNQSFVIPEYLNIFINSPSGREQMLERSRTTSGLYNLSVGRIKTIQVPLHSVNEQQRIVAKIDQLMSICDALEAKLKTAQTVRSHLTASILHGITNGGEAIEA